MDPFGLLKKDHEVVSKLFKRIESASGNAKLKVFKELKSELDLHAHIEETILYPALEKAIETRDLTLEAYEEHKVVKDFLSELNAAKAVSDEWKAKLTVLRENVEHHVDEEENELFGKAKKVLSDEKAETLGDRMQAEKVRRGARVQTPDAKTAKPGLLRTIVNALGIGAPTPKSSKALSKKKAATTKPAKKGAAVKPASSKSIKTPVTVAGKKSAPGRRTAAVGKTTAAGGAKARSVSSQKSAGKKPVARKPPAARKKAAAKKGKRG